jgi:deoxycytidine triphosphate deaminase
MILLTGKDAQGRVRNLVSEKHQVHGHAIELTAKQIYRLNPTGEVDFGGSEYVPAEALPLPSQQKHSQDKYQWWTLMHGAYRLEFNETLELAEDEIAFLEPHWRLLRAGAEHAATFIRGSVNPFTTLLSVTCAQLHIKQNARVSSLRVFRLPRAVAASKPAKAAKKKR